MALALVVVAGLRMGRYSSIEQGGQIGSFDRWTGETCILAPATQRNVCVTRDGLTTIRPWRPAR